LIRHQPFIASKALYRMTLPSDREDEGKGGIMAKCPKCGADVASPTKTWTLAPKGRRPVTIGLFKCPNGHFFRAGIKK